MIRLGLLDEQDTATYARIGFSENPKDEPAGIDPWWWEDHKTLARQLTDESIVLLNGSMLPLRAGRLRSIAVMTCGIRSRSTGTAAPLRLP